MDALVSHFQEDNGEKPKNSEVNWKPGSVEEWFESNDRRTKAQKKIQVSIQTLNYNIHLGSPRSIAANNIIFGI